MAVLYPATFPTHLEDDPGRRAERLVYDALSTLDDSWTVFYSVPWHLKAGTAAPRDGEGDFVVAHPDRGFVALEVKGGEIRYDPSRDRWTSTSRGGREYTIKDPAEQALETCKWLLGELKRAPAMRGHGWITAGHGVVFPDTWVGPKDVRSHIPRVLLLDAADLDDPAPAVDALFRHWQGDTPGPLGAPGLNVLAAKLATPVELKVPLALDLEREAHQILELTERQAAMLDWLGPRTRALIRGCAGSGKTFLALEKAERLAAEGRSVLLTCYNEPLGRFLDTHSGDGVTAVHFHGLCERLLADNGLPLPTGEPDPQTYFNTALPAAVADALERIPTRYDALIVDEGQDFDLLWLMVLEGLLAEPRAEQPLFVFVDEHQDIYGRAGAAAQLIAEPPFFLHQNLRTTRAIHDLAARFHPDPGSLSCAGPPGRPPEVAVYRDERDLLDRARRTLHRLLVDEEVPTRELAILTPRAQGRTAFTYGDTLGRFTLVEHRPATDTEVQVSTLHRFKGLERQVILLVEVDPRTGGDLDRLLYVGLSRAQGHLVVLCSQNLPADVLAKLTGEGSAPA